MRDLNESVKTEFILNEGLMHIDSIVNEGIFSDNTDYIERATGILCFLYNEGLMEDESFEEKFNYLRKVRSAIINSLLEE